LSRRKLSVMFIGLGLAVLCFQGGYIADRMALAGRVCVKIDPSGNLARCRGLEHGSAEQRRAAELLVDYLDHRNTGSLRQAETIYTTLASHLDLGTEIPSLRYICQYFLASPGEQAELLKHRDGARLLYYLSQSRFRSLRDTLIRLYGLAEGSTVPVPQSMSIIESLHNLDPTREEWDGIAELMAGLCLRGGDRVADIGVGAGLHTFRLAEAVGSTGRVYAVETNPDHLSFMQTIVQREGMTNVSLIRGQIDDVQLPANSIDCAFICALYHAIYGATPQDVREFFLGSVRRALRPGGRLAVCDNEPEPTKEPLLRGNLISRFLVAQQLSRYGFRLVKYYRIAGLRYLLIFEKQS
jgi:SAM-dependent methyltransferase